MKFQLILAACVVCFSCQSNDSKTAANEISQPKPGSEITPNQAPQPETFCYLHLSGDTPKQDSMIAEFIVDGHKISGRLDWIPYEKDSGRGSVLGVMDGGIITGVYNYVIEGSRQKEEVIFKMSDAHLIKKVGELAEKDGILKLKNPETAVFRDTLYRIDCD